MRTAFLIQVSLGGSPLYASAALGYFQGNSQPAQQGEVKGSQAGKLEVGEG